MLSVGVFSLQEVLFRMNTWFRVVQVMLCGGKGLLEATLDCELEHVQVSLLFCFPLPSL